jgi:hypothetical protein
MWDLLLSGGRGGARAGMPGVCRTWGLDLVNEWDS